jgi:hypothetical protein
MGPVANGEMQTGGACLVHDGSAVALNGIAAQGRVLLPGLVLLLIIELLA